MIVITRKIRAMICLHGSSEVIVSRYFAIKIVMKMMVHCRVDDRHHACIANDS